MKDDGIIINQRTNWYFTGTIKIGISMLISSLGGIGVGLNHCKFLFP